VTAPDDLRASDLPTARSCIARLLSAKAARSLAGGGITGYQLTPRGEHREQLPPALDPVRADRTGGRAPRGGDREVSDDAVLHAGKDSIPAQAGVAVYVRGESGRLAAARIYDDVTPPGSSDSSVVST
jgi:hypothetical protein